MEQVIAEVRRYLDRASAGLSTLHIGPLDYNLTTTIDDIRSAERVLEQFRFECEEYAALKR